MSHYNDFKTLNHKILISLGNVKKKNADVKSIYA